MTVLFDHIEGSRHVQLYAIGYGWAEDTVRASGEARTALAGEAWSGIQRSLNHNYHVEVSVNIDTNHSFHLGAGISQTWDGSARTWGQVETMVGGSYPLHIVLGRAVTENATQSRSQTKYGVRAKKESAEDPEFEDLFAVTISRDIRVP